MEPVREPELARRLARVLFSDIIAYAGDEVRIGLEKDDLFDRLAGEIERARVFYVSRVDPELSDVDKIFNYAMVDVLVARNKHVQTHIW